MFYAESDRATMLLFEQAASDGFVTKTLDRRLLWEMQTPQVPAFALVTPHYPCLLCSYPFGLSQLAVILVLLCLFDPSMNLCCNLFDAR